MRICCSSCSALLVGALLSIALLVISDMLRTNRTLVEDALERIKQLQYAPERIADPNAVRPDDAASWGHAWRRGNTRPRSVEHAVCHI